MKDLTVEGIRLHLGKITQGQWLCETSRSSCYSNRPWFRVDCENGRFITGEKPVSLRFDDDHENHKFIANAPDYIKYLLQRIEDLEK